MNNFIVKVSKNNRMVLPEHTYLGNDGENLQYNLEFRFIDGFVDGIARLEYQMEDEKYFLTLNKTNNSYTIPIKNVITKEGNIPFQLVITESETEDGIPLYKSDIFNLYCKESINAVGEAPDGYELWIDEANQKLMQIDEKIEEVNQAIIETDNLNITISKSEGTTTITLTKKDGSKEIVKVYDGETGNGIESITKTGTSGLVDTYTITYTDGTTTTFDVTNGEDGTDGRGILSITKTSTVGYVDTYTITYTDGTTTTFEVTNGEVSQAELDETNREVERAMMVYNALPKVTGTSTEITLDGTANCPMELELNPSELTQAGTPTPDNPSDVQVIKGNNSIKIENKNLIPFTNQDFTINNVRYYVQNGSLYLNGNSTSETSSKNANFKNNLNFILPAGTYTISHKTGVVGCYLYNYDDDSTAIKILGTNISSETFTLNATTNLYIGFYVYQNVFNNVNSEIMISKNGGDYAPHQEQVLPLNLPVENLFDRTNVKIGYTWNDTASAGRSVYYLNVKPGETYTVSSDKWNDLYYDILLLTSIGSTTFISETGWINPTTNPKTTIQISSGANILCLHFKYTSAGNITMTQTMFDNADIMLEKGSKANQYTPYGTAPIEYCKIGDYEDEFEHDGDKWYLNKHVGKIKLNGTETWTQGSDTADQNYYFTASYDSLISGTNRICNYFSNVYSSTNSSVLISTSYAHVRIYISKSFGIDTTTKLNQFLSQNDVYLYIGLATPTHTEITDTTLINQLNAIEQAVSYDEQTNISQTNAQLPFRIKASAVMSLANIFNTLSGGE